MRRLAWILAFWTWHTAVPAADTTVRLVAAATAGRAVEVRDLLAAGVDANTKNATGRPVLVLAGFNGNRRTVQALLTAGADVNLKDAVGKSAMARAKLRDYAPIIEVLKAAGAVDEGGDDKDAKQ